MAAAGAFHTKKEHERSSLLFFLNKSLPSLLHAPSHTHMCSPSRPASPSLLHSFFRHV